jgi:c-di-GMP-binding flagellar brake protein YcgR
MFPGYRPSFWHKVCKDINGLIIYINFVKHGLLMASFLERRRFSRIFVSLQVEYQARLPDSEISYQGQGYLRDISLSGVYFHVDSNMSFQQGQILSLSIFAPLQYLEGSDISHLRATGQVLRFDPPAPHQPLGGVALNFLEGPTFLGQQAPNDVSSSELV